MSNASVISDYHSSVDISKSTWDIFVHVRSFVHNPTLQDVKKFIEAKGSNTPSTNAIEVGCLIGRFSIDRPLEDLMTGDPEVLSKPTLCQIVDTILRSAKINITDKKFEIPRDAIANLKEWRTTNFD